MPDYASRVIDQLYRIQGSAYAALHHDNPVIKKTCKDIVLDKDVQRLCDTISTLVMMCGSEDLQRLAAEKMGLPVEGRDA